MKPDIPASDDGVTGPVDRKAAAAPWWPDVLAAAGADPAEREDRLDDLVLRDGSLTPDRASTADEDLTHGLCRLLAQRYEDGWQPDDLRHQLRRAGAAPAARTLLELALTLEFHRAGHRPDTRPARWSAQLGNDGGPVPAGLRVGAELDRWTFFEALVQVVAALVDLPRIEPLLPPPSQWTRRTPRLRAGVADRGALDRIRALLAKAEATTFPQEAEILTDKAQELMAKYAVDEVLVGTAEPAATEIVGRRVGLDEPFADEKATLAAVCATAQRCRAVHDPRLGHVTLLGTPGDVELAELLFSSVLVQAVHAMDAEARTRRSATRRPAFRRAFLVSYADRLATRWQEAARRAERSGSGADLVPVWHRRAAEVDRAVDRLFPHTVPGRLRSYDAAGWEAGSAAAAEARLDGRGPDR